MSKLFKRSLCCLAVLLTVALFLVGCTAKKPETVNTKMWFDYFDTVITVYGYDCDEADFKAVCADIESTLAYYDEQLSIFKEGQNNLYALNKNRSIEADDELIAFLTFARSMYELSGGKLNVMAGTLTTLWKDCIAGKSGVPSPEELTEASLHMDIDSLVIEENTVSIADEKALIDAGALGKGYVGQLLSEMLEGKTIALDLGGNLVLVGDREWKLGIKDPKGSDVPIARIKVNEGSLVTSGNYERFIEVDGKRYHHIIDPDTLCPSDKYLSVSIYSPDSALADALSTALFCMDEDEALGLIERVDAECYLIKSDGSIVMSSGFSDLLIR